MILVFCILSHTQKKLSPSGSAVEQAAVETMAYVLYDEIKTAKIDSRSGSDGLKAGCVRAALRLMRSALKRAEKIKSDRKRESLRDPFAKTDEKLSAARIDVLPFEALGDQSVLTQMVLDAQVCALYVNCIYVVFLCDIFPPNSWG